MDGGPCRVSLLLCMCAHLTSTSTLKIIFQARSIHEGKGYKKGFFRCAAWLWENHPRTFLAK